LTSNQDLNSRPEDNSRSEIGGALTDTIRLLRIMQNDYQGARRQLEQVSHDLAERENLIGQHIQHAFLSSSHFHPLCLLEYKVGSRTNQLGSTILGRPASPPSVPGAVRLYINCLGRFEVRSPSKRIEHWRSVKAKSAFQYLLTKPREPAIKEAIMDALWPDCAAPAAGNNLKAAIHNLKQTVNALFDGGETLPCVLFLQGSYLINPLINLTIDVEEFERRWAAGRRFEKDRRMDEAVTEFERAESLYKGDYLEDEPYEEWTLMRREALKDTYLLILDKLADHALRASNYESCILYCQKILAKDHCREDTYRRLMTCYSRLGQTNRAIRWYQICSQTIQSELDASLSDETIDLYESMFKRKDSLR
jgi:DNA-binding SARP family transcriptional activator